MHALPSRARAVLALLVLALLALPATVASAVPPERSLTVMSYNIHHGVGEADVLDLDRIADVIAESGADVVALQEVDRHWSARSDLADQAEVLGELLDMHVAYGANLDRDPAEEAQPRRQYGTAILSTYPILDSDNTLLPNLGGEQRGLLEARINVRGRQALVYSTHLQHDSATERAAQTEAIVDLVGDATLPVVLTGDLNATPDATEMTRSSSRSSTATWPPVTATGSPTPRLTRTAASTTSLPTTTSGSPTATSSTHSPRTTSRWSLTWS